MSNTDWVKPYINELLSSDLKTDAEKLITKKMIHINMPFYKYCSVSEEAKRKEDEIDYNIENFKNDELYFQNPANFNDPFDCFLGFSQIQLVRNLLIATLRNQKKYTPQMRKAITSFFSQGIFNPTSYNSITADEWSNTISNLIPLFLSQFEGDELMSEHIRSFFGILLKEENSQLFLKLVQNRLTIMDRQKLIDIMYSDENYKKMLESKIELKESTETILKIAQYDMKYKIETVPDFVFSDTDTEAFQTFDLFQLLVKSQLNNNEAPEFQDIKKQLNTSSKEAMQSSRKIISDQCRVTCLSERMDSPLMWSHYANKHYGFCLEYDFTYNLVKNYPDLWLAKLMLYPVIYSENRPLLTGSIARPDFMLQYLKNQKIPEDIIKSIIYGLLFKSEDWEYEREWRIIIINHDKPTLKLPPARKVFLGANIENSAKEKIIKVAKTKNIPIFQMYLATDKYRFDYFRVK